MLPQRVLGEEARASPWGERFMPCLSPGSGAGGVCGGASPGEGASGHRVTPAVEDTRVVTRHRAGAARPLWPALCGPVQTRWLKRTRVLPQSWRLVAEVGVSGLVPSLASLLRVPVSL